MKKPLSKLPAKTYVGFGLSMLDRAVKEAFAERCTDGDLGKLRTEFEKNGSVICIYCGNRDATRWDHYVPVSKGGDTVPGNLVPACAACDDSKQDKTLDEWSQSSSEKRPSPERVKEIHKIVANHQTKHGYVPRPFEQKISERQAEIYAEFQRQVNGLRKYLVENGVITK